VITFWIKYQVPIAIGTTRMLHRVTQPPHIAGPLWLIRWFRDIYTTLKELTITQKRA
jgi:hypothetical protein